MHILVGQSWEDGYPDYHRPKDQYRVKVLAMKNLERIEGMFYIRPRSLRLVANYLLEIGFRQLFRKIRSRMRETGRNEKFLSCGMGIVLEAPPGGTFQEGQEVIFLANCHPPCVERLVLPEGFMAIPSDPIVLPREAIEKGSVLRVPPSSESLVDQPISRIGTHSQFSGDAFPAEIAQKTMDRVKTLLANETWKGAERLPIVNKLKSTLSESIPALSRASFTKKPRGVIFGFGNYAKTFLIPNVSPHILIEGIHEIDPTQVDRTMTGNSWDTCPDPRAGEKADVYFAAGFHHTHVPVALAALEQGAYAVVEKPVATTEDQLGLLLGALGKNGPKLFSCFHKRFLSFNKFAWEDLGSDSSETPISYSCLVYEVPLPPNHWYRWPNSRSRLVSNGCHWLDHFLFLNRYPEVEWFDLVIAPDETLNVSVRCANGAFFTMVLTDQGSERIGLRDYIELRRPDVTVRMTDGGTYLAENGARIIRKAGINKLSSYGNMYSEIARRIAAGEPGDSIESVRISAGLILGLERLFQERIRKAG